MTDPDVQTAAVRDPRLAALAASATPAWLWSADGRAVLWMNAAAAASFGVTAETTADEESQRQIAQLAGQLDPGGAPRLEKLRDFGAPLGQQRTYVCSRLAMHGGADSVLIAAAEPPGRPLSQVRRLGFLTDRLPTPAAAFNGKGDLLTWNAGAEDFVDGKLTLAALGLEDAKQHALREGFHTLRRDDSAITLCRLGGGDDASFVALIEPASALAAPQIFASPADQAPAGNGPGAKHEDSAAAPSATIEITPSAVAAVDAAPPESIVDEAFADEVLVDEDESAPSATTRDRPAGEPEATATAVTEPAGTESDGIADEAFADEILVDEDEPEASAGTSSRSQTTDAPAQPVRFSWVMNADGRFALGSDEFSRLVGPQTSAAFGRPWREISGTLHLDPSGAFEKAVAARAAFADLVVNWPFDGGDTRLPVALSAEPIFDRHGGFAGYRGVGVCSDLGRLTELARRRRAEAEAAPAAAAAERAPAPEEPFIVPELASPHTVGAAPALAATDTRSGPGPEIASAENVVPFRPAQDAKADAKSEAKADQPAPTLSPGENHAFDEIARRLTARLDQATHGLHRDVPDDLIAGDAVPATAPRSGLAATAAAPWLAPVAASPHGSARQDGPILDQIPSGVLIYSLDRLLYANPAFLRHAGFSSLAALTDAGGLDALFVEPAASPADSPSDGGTALTIAGRGDQAASDARLFSIVWDGEPAMALILSGGRPLSPADPADAQTATPQAAAAAADADVRAILDTAADGIVVFERSGEITSCNRSAEALFGHDASGLVAQNLADLFAPESQRVVLDYFEGIDAGHASSMLDHGREVLARVRGGGIIPLAMTMGRTSGDAGRFFAVFRDLSQIRKNEADLFSARRQAERAQAARTDVVSRIDHEIRAPLNAIIGFADVMIEERFGPLGNERYAEYLKDIRASGERVLAIVGDMLDLSRIESGKLDLTLSGHNLNAAVEHGVAALQPQANRERIIIRTSLAHALPLVLADARTLSQIVTNIITAAIRLSDPGGQVIVSTALGDKGEAMLRIRNTGQCLSEQDIAAAIDPYGSFSPEQNVVTRFGVKLSLTKALAEANRARFQIRATPPSGTLIEVMFSTAAAPVR